MKQKYLKTLIMLAFIFFSTVYLEVLFKIRVLSFDFNQDFFRILLFSFSYSLLFLFILKFFKTRTVRIILYTIFPILVLLYLNQEVYSSFVEGFYSIRLAGDLTQGLTFISEYFGELKFMHLFYFLPVILLVLGCHFKVISANISYDGLKQPLFFLFSGFLIYFISMNTIDENIDSGESTLAYSDMDLYTYMYSPQMALKKFGLLTYTQRDFFSLFRSDPLTENEYDILLADFFENQPLHYDNTYTNLLRGKNLILIMAESLDTFAINEELTPTLYNIKENYGYFENYYSPLYYRSTADTEFLAQTSFYPDKNVTLSMKSYLENTFPNTLPKLFSSRGYSTYSFHNYTDYFYPRTTFHQDTLGYDAYYGSEELGILDNPPEGQFVTPHIWQSDLELMEKALPYFIDDDKFFVNMVSVSGHLPYNQDHPIGSLHEAAVTQYEIDQGIELPEEIKWYLAANMEFDLAIQYLMDELEAANKLDDTVIMIFGDHYAYGIDNKTIWEYDDIKVNEDEMDINNVPFLVISDSYMLNTVVPNYMSSVDILPTVANLFGLPLNYQQVFGEDS